MGSEEESRPENQAEANEAHEQSDAAAFYEEQAEALQDTPEVQRLVQLRAAEMRGHQIGEAGSAPGQTKDLSVAEEEVVHTEIALTIIGL
ncbi:MAG TPA: hypothetical protein VMR98_04115, partial [Candidatus Polarisedimenticolaceae bacterium]|nr:hypothetical protein [Candidatus Polarisedimenticolaceae bacterium]